ncbi:MAG: 50S ribosomal protein L24 [Gammaproteobacteria bacterium RIFCSPHIGHO2_12_FULL_38_11]|nr:MAG: 50S ribosomal protein L24 [Gammaproteobacteria bacterium RIFCSPHIGHO2_12_FULL_38_11]
MKKIKKGDKVVVLTGKDRGRSGTIIKVLADDRALVEGINLVKKNVKPNPNTRTQGGIVEKESSIHLSNIALLNPATNKADKVGFKMIEPKVAGEKAKKARYFKSNNELVDAEPRA